MGKRILKQKSPIAFFPGNAAYFIKINHKNFSFENPLFNKYWLEV